MVTALGLGSPKRQGNSNLPGLFSDLNGPVRDREGDMEGDFERREVQICAGRDVCGVEEAARKLMVAARAYVPVSHLCWGLWGIIQGGVSSVDFDFEAYARQRIHEYLVAKSKGSGPEMATSEC